MPKLYTKNTWLNEVLAGAERYDIKEDGGAAFKNNMQILLATSVSQAGTLADADKMNNLENGLDAVDTALSGGWQPVTQTWAAASSDDPVYQIYVSGNVTANVDYKLGNKIAVTISGADRYGFIVKIGAYDGSNNRTPIDIYGGTDYDITGTMTNPRISKIKSPDGFPLSPTKWTVEFTDTSLRIQNTPTATTKYNPGSLAITIPIGDWNTEYQVVLDGVKLTATTAEVICSLSTANNSESDADFRGYAYVSGASGTINVINTIYKRKNITLTSKTSYYLIIWTNTASMNSISFDGNQAKTIIRAICNYL